MLREHNGVKNVKNNERKGESGKIKGKLDDGESIVVFLWHMSYYRCYHLKYELYMYKLY